MFDDILKLAKHYETLAKKAGVPEGAKHKDCGGNGCSKCNGSGVDQSLPTCNMCGGTSPFGDPCKQCGGTGKLFVSLASVKTASEDNQRVANYLKGMEKSELLSVIKQLVEEGFVSPEELKSEEMPEEFNFTSMTGSGHDDKDVINFQSMARAYLAKIKAAKRLGE